ncbi:hypothetical protein PIB30_021403 [Stylosanthes scabra]|uniref:Uncharacterized protein n=1 Tax=Stylosanthes scabra TaxID=79078 RepID=A0ABU6TA01_9FABA|nr:hypothetical protein [Stylosanthes scabra]
MTIGSGNVDSSRYVDDTSGRPLEKRLTTRNTADRTAVCSSSSHINKTSQRIENENVYTHRTLENPAWEHSDVTTWTPLSNLTNCSSRGSIGLRSSLSGNSTHDCLKVNGISWDSEITLRNRKKILPGKTVIHEAHIVKNIARNPNVLFSNATVDNHQDVSKNQPMQLEKRLLSVVHDVAQPTTVNNMEAFIDLDPLVDYEGVNAYDDSNLDQDIDDSTIPYHDETIGVSGGVLVQMLISSALSVKHECGQMNGCPKPINRDNQSLAYVVWREKWCFCVYDIHRWN